MAKRTTTSKKKPIATEDMCPNCHETAFDAVKDIHGAVIPGQKKCKNCSYVITQE